MKIDWRRAAPIFLLGLLLGAVAGSWAQRAMMHHWRRRPDTSRMVEKMSRELDLDAAQKDAVKTLLESGRAKLDVLHKESVAQFEAMRAATRGDIRKLLTAEQQVKFDEMTARLEARNKRR